MAYRVGLLSPARSVEGPPVVRALLWLLPGVVLFLVVATLLAPPALLGRTLGLATLAMVPGLLVLVLVADVRRRRRQRVRGDQ